MTTPTLHAPLRSPPARREPDEREDAAVEACFEAAGFTAVKTLLSSGNVVFDGRAASDAAVERKAETAMQELLGRTFTRTWETVRKCAAA